MGKTLRDQTKDRALESNLLGLGSTRPTASGPKCINTVLLEVYICTQQWNAHMPSQYYYCYNPQKERGWEVMGLTVSIIRAASGVVTDIDHNKISQI